MKKSGIGIAVENAISEVKAVADFICDTNDNDGVAEWIEENVTPSSSDTYFTPIFHANFTDSIFY